TPLENHIPRGLDQLPAGLSWISHGFWRPIHTNWLVFNEQRGIGQQKISGRESSVRFPACPRRKFARMWSGAIFPPFPHDRPVGGMRHRYGWRTARSLANPGEMGSEHDEHRKPPAQKKLPAIILWDANGCMQNGRLPV